MSGGQRWTLLLAMLGLTLGGVAWVYQQDQVIEPVRAARPEATQKIERKGNTQPAQALIEDGVTLRLSKLQREALAEGDAPSDLFAAKSWYVPPPPPKPLPPPPPSAPPLPFAYMGKMIEDGHLTVFLTKQDRNYVVKAGETLEGMYKVESVTPLMMTLVYLPLNIKQTLMIGGE